MNSNRDLRDSIKIPQPQTKILKQTKHDIIKKCYMNDDLQGLITKMKTRGLTKDMIKEKVGYLTKPCIDEIKNEQLTLQKQNIQQINQKNNKVSNMDDETIEKIIVEAVKDENIMKDVILFKKMKTKNNESNMCKIPIINKFLC